MRNPCKYTVTHHATRIAELFQALVAAIQIINSVYYTVLTPEQQNKLDSDTALDQAFEAIDTILQKWA